MNITIAKYNKIDENNVSISIKLAGEDGFTMSVPLDPNNMDYVEIMRRVDEDGLTIEPADEPE